MCIRDRFYTEENQWGIGRIPWHRHRHWHWHPREERIGSLRGCKRVGRVVEDIGVGIGVVECGLIENVEFCTSAASDDSHVELSQHFRSFLIAIYICRLYWDVISNVLSSFTGCSLYMYVMFPNIETRRWLWRLVMHVNKALMAVSFHAGVILANALRDVA